MPADQPFQPNTGGTVSVTAISTSGAAPVTIAASVIGFAPSMLVTNGNTVTIFVRIDKSTATLATSVDTPIIGNTQKLLANPYPTGPAVVSVAATLNGGSSPVWFTPGEGGIV
jgi:hypothetical protein